MSGVTAACAPRLTAPAVASQTGQPRREVDDAGGGREGELETRLPQITGPPEQQGEDGERQCVEKLRFAVEEEGGQQEQPHHGGPHDRGLTAHHEGEADEDDGGNHRGPAARDAAHREAAEHRPRQQCHVEARHREDVIDPGPPERLVALGRQRGALAQQEPGQQRARGLREPRRDDADRPPFHRDPPGGRVRRQGADPIRARVAHEQDPLAAEMGGVVEAARVPEADRPMQPGVQKHALALPERGVEQAVDRDLNAAHRGQALGSGVHRLRVEQEARAVRCPLHGLLGQPRLQDQGRVWRPPCDVVGGQDRWSGAERAEPDHGRQDERRGRTRPPRCEEQPGEEEGRVRADEEGRGHREPRRAGDARGEGGGGQQERRGVERPVSHSRL
jgi:hypothetical protein